MVAAGHPATVAAAVDVLRAGGNAYDAAVAAGFASGVAEPCLSSLGGGGFLLARTAGGEEVVFDFFVDTPGRGRSPDAPPALVPVTLHFPGADQVFHVGHGSVAVPGCLAGFLHVHRRLGRLPLSEVLAPAIALARDGVVLGPQQAGVVRLLEPILTASNEGRRRFLIDGEVLGAGSSLENAPLARFLTALADGTLSGFDDPDLARAIAADMAASGGAVTAEDLAAYRVVERPPLVAHHRGARVVTNPPPSFGGTLVLRALEVLAAGDAPAGDDGAALVRLVDVLDEVTRHHTASQPVSTQGTTHVSIADQQGNLAAMTVSNGSCSGVYLPGTGVMANNIMGEEDLHPAGFHHAEPGVRVGSMMAPTVVRPPDGDPVALGSGGSERIRSALTQVLLALLVDGRDLEAAVHAPRLHWDGSTVQAEPGFPPDALAVLAQHRPVNVWRDRDLYFGGVHAVCPSGARVGDPRRGGSTGLA